jgi:transcriptional regulator with XRE-family HTH domain
MATKKFNPLDEKKLNAIKEIDYKKLKKKVIDLQEKNSLTDRSMAAILDMAPQNYARYLAKDTSKPTIRGIHRLAKYFDMTLDVILDLPTEKPPLKTGEASDPEKEKELKHLKEQNELLRMSLDNCMKLNKMLEKAG